MLQDCYRLLEPGGVLVLADSVQLADSPQFDIAMENFRRVFHEPYYRDFISDDINQRLIDADSAISTPNAFHDARLDRDKPERT